MPDISEYYSGGSSLKAEDIDDEMIVTIAAWRKQTFDDGGVSYFLKLKGEDKEFRCNKTNAKRIAQMYGTDIDNWVGKELSLLPDVIPSGEYAGKSTIIVRVRKSSAKAAPKRPQNGPKDDHPFAPGNDDDGGF